MKQRENDCLVGMPVGPDRYVTNIHLLLRQLH